jgi:hypothetical protein
VVARADAGVTLDDGAAGLQNAARLGIPDDGQGGAVLDRTARIHELRLAGDRAAGGVLSMARARPSCQVVP